ncbi:ABC-2 type transport system permease protein [Natranaerovirga pectinivora]|uniref:ABC-2 type transport system permease protein n=1 Tax=Natranaerovirga pectinivora TaxID=682400 RepID=A0A4R3MF27_9FIRM|nr:ABC transporter permease [Natranaerovirga pectinivora]TCT12287.1 ABC-2 type transport system permease protein [Natranaerovirga pectinivora]
MRALAYIKLTLRDIFKNFPLLFLSLSVLPLGLAIALGFFMDSTSTMPEIPNIKVVFIDEDESILSNELIEILTNGESDTFIHIDEDRYNYEIIIPSGYEVAMVNHKPLNIEVKLGENASSNNADILMNVIDIYNGEIHKGIIINKRLEEQNISVETKNDKLMEIQLQLQQINEQELFTTNLVESKKIFTSFENYSIASYSFSFMFLVIIFLASNFMEKDLGLYKRINATPMTRTQYYNYSLISGAIGIFIFNMVYVLILRVLGLSFQGRFLDLLIIQVVMTLVASGLVGLLWAFMNKNSSLILLNTIILVQMLFGYFPKDLLGEGSVFSRLSSFTPDILITRTISGYILHGTIERVMHYLVILLGIALICYLIGLVKANIRWRNE